MVNDMKSKTEKEVLIESAVQGLYYLAVILEAKLKKDTEEYNPSKSYLDERQLEINEKKKLAKDFLYLAETL